MAAIKLDVMDEQADPDELEAVSTAVAAAAMAIPAAVAPTTVVVAAVVAVVDISSGTLSKIVLAFSSCTSR